MKRFYVDTSSELPEIKSIDFFSEEAKLRRKKLKTLYDSFSPMFEKNFESTSMLIENKPKNSKFDLYKTEVEEDESNEDFAFDV